MRALGVSRGELGKLFFADAKPSGAESGKGTGMGLVGAPGTPSALFPSIPFPDSH